MVAVKNVFFHNIGCFSAFAPMIRNIFYSRLETKHDVIIYFYKFCGKYVMKHTLSKYDISELLYKLRSLA